MTTQFPLFYLESFGFDIFGSQKTVEEKTIVNKGLISQDLYQPIKIHLKRLGNKFLEENKLFQEQRTSLIDEYFDKVENNYELKKDANVDDFNEKVKALAETKISLEHYDFKLEDFNFKGDEIYEFVDFITKEKEEN